MRFLLEFVLLFATASASALNDSRSPAKEEDSRIINGDTAATGQFPYQVGLFLYNINYQALLCGGSLISTTRILTAAHCVEGSVMATVFLGATIHTEPELTFTVFSNQVVIHPGWQRQTMKNDIALIKIPPVTLSSKIQIVPLPTIAGSYPTHAGEDVIASGWGRVTENGPTPTKYLQWTRMKIVENSQCQLTFNSLITDFNICTSTAEGTSTCVGDSGGPLVLESSGVLVGLTSFGSHAGCMAREPAVFTRVSSHLNWIRANSNPFIHQ